jgi:hypothetical protein
MQFSHVNVFCAALGDVGRNERIKAMEREARKMIDIALKED